MGRVLRIRFHRAFHRFDRRVLDYRRPEFSGVGPFIQYAGVNGVLKYQMTKFFFPVFYSRLDQASTLMQSAQLTRI